MRKLNRNIIAVVATIIFLCVIAVGTFASIRAREIINSDEEKYAALFLQEEQTFLDDIMGNIKDSVDVLSITAKNDLTSTDTITDASKREAYTAKMKEILATVSENTNGVVFSYLRFSPSLAPSTSGLFMQKDELSERFIELIPTDFSLYDENDVEHVGWYYIPVKTGKAVWMDPYFNNNVDVYMISYVVPLFIGNQAIGVIGMDVDFTYITNQVKESTLYKSGYMCLLNGNRKVQYHPTVSFGETFTPGKDDFFGNVLLVNGMLLELVIPESQIYASGNNLMHEIIISLSVITVLYLVCLVLFMRAISKREGEQARLGNEINSVAGIYVSMHKIGVRKNQITEYYANEFFSSQFQRNFPRIKDLLYSIIKQNVNVDNQEMMREFCNVDTLPMRMTDKKTISVEFQSRDFGWCRARFIRIENQSVADEVVFAIEQINDEKEKENHLLYLSETDLMTGLKNRGSGENRIRDLISKKQSGAFILMDVDKFKRFNDTYGHAAGDEVIISVASALQSVFGNDNIVMRLGGDEFAVFMPNAVSESMVKERLYVLFAHLENLRIESIKNTAIYLSLGISFYDGSNYASFDTMYHDADEAAYRSKAVVGNSYSFYNKTE